ncbi:MAG TPA: hypothetical protein VK213_12900 [Bacteroidales bacterium]|nr:hypothetical protein [Bacteroidales bacterium]
MKVFMALKYALTRIPATTKAVLVELFSYLFVTVLVAYPLKRTVIAGFGRSMITERMREVIDVEAFLDLGPVLKSLISQVWGGLLVIIMAGFVLNAFFSGGLFAIVRSEGLTSVKNFFYYCAALFWSNFVVLFIMSLIMFLAGIISIIVPLGIAGAGMETPDITVLKAVLAGFTAYLLIILPPLLIAADYARAWLAATNENRPFRALGYGFSRIFSSFRSSYFLMILILVIQVIFLLLYSYIIPFMTPSDHSGIFYLFIASQLMFTARLFLKVLRYGAITFLYEHLPVQPDKLSYDLT